MMSEQMQIEEKDLLKMMITKQLQNIRRQMKKSMSQKEKGEEIGKEYLSSRKK